MALHFFFFSSSAILNWFHVLASSGDVSTQPMFGQPGPPGSPGPPGDKGEPGVPSGRHWSLDSEDYSNMAGKVTDYIKCGWWGYQIHKHMHTLTAWWVFPIYHVIQHLPICFPHVAHGLIRDLFRGTEHLIRGPPGPPGIPGVPGQNSWVSSRDNVVDMVDYIKCKLILALLT